MAWPKLIGYLSMTVPRHCGAKWLSGKFSALCPESRRFECHSCSHAWTLGLHSQMPVALRHVNSDTVSKL